MKKYIIYWDAGYGRSYDVVEAENEEKATEHAYESWRDEAESQADYGVQEYSDEAAEDLGI